MQYVELHARSAFSFLEGGSPPEALAYACFEKQLPADLEGDFPIAQACRQSSRHGRSHRLLILR